MQTVWQNQSVLSHAQRIYLTQPFILATQFDHFAITAMKWNLFIFSAVAKHCIPRMEKQVPPK